MILPRLTPKPRAEEAPPASANTLARSRADEAARALRLEDAARRATSVPPPAPRYRA